MKKFVPIAILLVFFTFIFFKLKSNKKKIDEATVLSEATVDRIPVRIYEVKPLQLTKTLRISGQLSSQEDLMLLSATQGRIDKVARKKGDWVTKGSLIAKVEDVLYREEFEITKSSYEKLKKDLERFKNMEETEAVTAQQREGVELNLRAAEAKYLAAKKQLEDAYIKAPIAGYINQLFIKEGGLLGKGTPVCEIVNTKSLKLVIKASEYELPDISKSSEVVVVVPTFPDDTLQAQISFQSVKADYSNLYEIELVLDNAEGAHKAGMLGTALFKISSESEHVFVPESTILGNEQKYVFLEDGNIAKIRDVHTGSKFEDFVEVSEGVQLGDKIITDGNTIVRSGQPVTVVDQ